MAGRSDRVRHPASEYRMPYGDRIKVEEAVMNSSMVAVDQFDAREERTKESARRIREYRQYRRILEDEPVGSLLHDDVQNRMRRLETEMYA